MKVDILQWLHDTGGNNAIKRFSADSATEQSQSAQTGTKPAANVTLSKNDAASLKSSLQYNRVAQIVGFSGGNVINLSNPTNSTTMPVTQAKTPVDTNRVNFNRESDSTNTAAVTGKNNVVDFSSPYGYSANNKVAITGNRNTIRGYNGGQSANTVSITGNSNSIMAADETAKNTVSVIGNNNNAALGSNTASNTVSVKGNSVSVLIGSQAEGENSNQGWNISVSADNINVQIVNGKAQVNVSDQDKNKYQISINNDTKSVVVSSSNPSA
jgi:hypothetical protein